MPAVVKHLVHVFSTFAPGGPQRRTADIFNHLPPRFRHTVLSTNNDLSARELLKADAPVEYANVPKNARGRVRRGELRKLLVQQKPDLIITYNWGATEAIQAIGIRRFCPILHAQDGFGPEEATYQIARRLWMRRVLYRLAEAVVVPSQTLEKIAVETWWLPRRRVLYIPNGIDINKYAGGNDAARAAFRSEYSIPESGIIVGMVAHLRAEKNPARLLRAFASAPDANSYLIFAGDGPLRAELESTAKLLNIQSRVRFCGHLQNPAAAYSAFDIFALSSDTEQMPISVLEAMGSGIPVVSTNVGDIYSMVAPANQPFITKLGDDAAYASALAVILKDLILQKRIGAANRARCVSHFSLEQQNNAYCDLYDRFSRPRSEIWRSEQNRN
ncbi:MAG: glycosyltransferase [Planctomycetota bacterium]